MGSVMLVRTRRGQPAAAEGAPEREAEVVRDLGVRLPRYENFDRALEICTQHRFRACMPRRHPEVQ